MNLFQNGSSDGCNDVMMVEKNSVMACCRTEDLPRDIYYFLREIQCAKLSSKCQATRTETRVVEAACRK